MNKSPNIFIEVFKEPVSGSDGTLKDLTFAVKDNIPIQGKELSFGTSPLYRGRNENSAEIVSKLISLGANCIGRTNLDEYALNYSGKNPYYGQINNSGFPGRSVLGSSGGSAEAVAMEACDFALGTDLGGSIRTPAAATRTYGLKLTAGSYYCPYSLLLSKDIDSYGILAKSLKSLEKVATAIFDTETNESDKIEYLGLDHIGTLTPDFYNLYSKTISSLKNKFSAQAIKDPSIFMQAREAWKTLAIRDLTDSLRRFGISDESDTDIIKASYNKRELISDEDINMATLKRDNIRESLGDNFLIITPTLSGPSPLLNQSEQEEVNYNFPGYFMSLANLLGLPSLSIPIEGQFSIQIIGSKNKELSLISLAKKIKGV